MNQAYMLAQDALGKLRGAVHLLLVTDGSEGLSNAQIGRSLGIYSGHVGHEGHISRTILALMEAEGVVRQDAKTKCWHLREHQEAADSC